MRFFHDWKEHEISHPLVRSKSEYLNFKLIYLHFLANSKKGEFVYCINILFQIKKGKFVNRFVHLGLLLSLCWKVIFFLMGNFRQRLLWHSYLVKSIKAQSGGNSLFSCKNIFKTIKENFASIGYKISFFTFRNEANSGYP